MIDSQSAVDMRVTYRDTKHTHHIMRHFHYVQEGVESKQHVLIWLPTKLQLTDIGTKPLIRSKFKPMMKYIMVRAKEE